MSSPSTQCNDVYSTYNYLWATAHFSVVKLYLFVCVRIQDSGFISVTCMETSTFSAHSLNVCSLEDG